MVEFTLSNNILEKVGTYMNVTISLKSIVDLSTLFADADRHYTACIDVFANRGFASESEFNLLMRDIIGNNYIRQTLNKAIGGDEPPFTEFTIPDPMPFSVGESEETSDSGTSVETADPVTMEGERKRSDDLAHSEAMVEHEDAVADYEEQAEAYTAERDVSSSDMDGNGIQDNAENTVENENKRKALELTEEEAALGGDLASKPVVNEPVVLAVNEDLVNGVVAAMPKPDQSFNYNSHPRSQQSQAVKQSFTPVSVEAEEPIHTADVSHDEPEPDGPF